MQMLDIVACVGGSFVLFTYLILMCYLYIIREDQRKMDLILGPFKTWMCCWTVLCFITTSASVLLFLEVSKDPKVSAVGALVAFLCSATCVSPLIILDVKYHNVCTISLLGICMVATPCAWLVFFASGPVPTAFTSVLFIWSFVHHALFDSSLWFAYYLDTRSFYPTRTPSGALN